MESLNELRTEVTLLRSRLENVEQKLISLEAEQVSEQPLKAMTFDIPRPTNEVSGTTAPPPQTSYPSTRLTDASEGPTQPDQRSTDLETMIGGSWLNKIGAATLILGMGFFLKYAIDNQWINEIARIVLGFLAGLACLGLGELFQRRELPRFAQGLSGAGIAILYFTVFAAYSFYSLLPTVPAFMLMGLITAVAIALSVFYDAISIAVLGILGGFITPTLFVGGDTGGGGPNTSVLIYIAILDLGILGITRFKNWRGLNLVSLFGTVLIFCAMDASRSSLSYSIGFATMYFLIFAAQAYVQNVMTRRLIATKDVWMAVLPPILYFLYCYDSLDSKGHALMLAPFAVIMAALYTALSHKVFSQAFDDPKLCTIYLAIGAGFLTIAVPLQLHGYWIAWGWAIESAILLGIGFYLDTRKTRSVALGVLALAGGQLLLQTADSVAVTQQASFTLIGLPTYVLLTGLAFGMAYLYHRKREILSKEETTEIPDALVVLGAVFLLIGLTTEIYTLTRVLADGIYISTSITLLWAVYGLIAIIIGISTKHRPLRLFGLVLFGITLWKTYLSDVWSLDFLSRTLAFIALGIVLLAVSYFYQKYPSKIRQFVTGKEKSIAEK